LILSEILVMYLYIFRSNSVCNLQLITVKLLINTTKKILNIVKTH